MTENLMKKPKKQIHINQPGPASKRNGADKGMPYPSPRPYNDADFTCIFDRLTEIEKEFFLTA